MKNSTLIIIFLLLIFSSVSTQGLAQIDGQPVVKYSCGTQDFIKAQGCALLSKKNYQCEELGLYPYIQDSCWENSIPEVDPANKDTLVISPYLLTKNSINKIAQELLYRYYSLNERPHLSPATFEKSAYSLFKSIEPQVQFNDKIIEKIKLNGFLNQHQTQTSGGILNDNKRWHVEEMFLNISLPHSMREAQSLAPKYLYAIPTERIIKFFGGQSRYSKQYGNLIAVLSSKIKNRMTITMGDSLHNFLVYKNYRLNTLKWVSSELDYKIDGYIEGQVWGTLDFSDIEYLLVNCPRLEKILPDRIQEIYNITKIPIYSCKLKRSKNAQHFVRKKLLF